VLINRNTSYFQTILLTLGGMTVLVIALLFAKLILLGCKQIAKIIFSPDNFLGILRVHLCVNKCANLCLREIQTSRGSVLLVF